MTDTSNLAPKPIYKSPGVSQYVYDYLKTRPNHSATVEAVHQNAKRDGTGFSRDDIAKAMSRGVTNTWLVIDRVLLSHPKQPHLYRIATLEEYRGTPEVAKPPTPTKKPKWPKNRAPNSRAGAIVEVLRLKPYGESTSFTELWNMLPAALPPGSGKRGSKQNVRQSLHDLAHRGMVVRTSRPRAKQVMYRWASLEEFNAKQEQTGRDQRKKARRAIIDSGDTVPAVLPVPEKQAAAKKKTKKRKPAKPAKPAVDQKALTDVVDAVESLRKEKIGIPTTVAVWGVIVAAGMSALLGYIVGGGA